MKSKINQGAALLLCLLLILSCGTAMAAATDPNSEYVPASIFNLTMKIPEQADFYAADQVFTVAITAAPETGAEQTSISAYQFALEVPESLEVTSIVPAEGMGGQYEYRNGKIAWSAESGAGFDVSAGKVIALAAIHVVYDGDDNVTVRFATGAEIAAIDEMRGPVSDAASTVSVSLDAPRIVAVAAEDQIDVTPVKMGEEIKAWKVFCLFYDEREMMLGSAILGGFTDHEMEIAFDIPEDYADADHACVFFLSDNGIPQYRMLTISLEGAGGEP